LLCAGFLFGGYIGASLIQSIPDAVLKKSFGAFLLIISLNMILGK